VNEKTFDDAGKRVFFLYPHSVIEDKIVSVIIRGEFEVYLVYDKAKTVSLMKKFPGSILFINIDRELQEEDWEKYITSIRNSEGTADTQIGILSYNEDKDLSKKYLMDIGIQCGFVRLKLGVEESSKILLKTLIATEARGKRKYVRARCDKLSNVSFNIQNGGGRYTGSIIDISVAGMACTFSNSAHYSPGDRIKDIQLVLKGKRVSVSGILAGKRDTDGSDLYVIMFTEPISGESKDKIHDFIHLALQENISRLMNVL